MVKQEKVPSKVITRSTTRHIETRDSDSDDLGYPRVATTKKGRIIQDTPSSPKEEQSPKYDSQSSRRHNYDRIREERLSSPTRPPKRMSRRLAALTRPHLFNGTVPSGDITEDSNQSQPGAVRRSTRPKKLLYKNLNQHWLVDEERSLTNHYFSPSSPLAKPNESSHSADAILEDDIRHSCSIEAQNNEEDFEDMYSRVKRVRRKATNGFFADPGLPKSSQLSTMTDDESASSNTDDEEEAPPSFRYSLRQRNTKPPPQEFPTSEGSRRPKKPKTSLYDSHFPHDLFDSPSSRSSRYKRKPHAIHNGSSTCSDSSDEERKFEKREARSIARARNRCLPVNYKEDKEVSLIRGDPNPGVTETKPMNIDETITFESIGGLDKHIAALKEMIIFPILYPEVFAKYKMAPPRGVIFHGPPGTGKTLVARALANEIGKIQGVKYSFFMRKGADCFSKWVGESERHIRVLFDQAYQMRPSIIFFDEIDGLAPARTSRQDQIHCSVVSTLLAVMDGLDNRGEIVVIGATNRIDALDPALRRPGRFDREFLFPLPNLQARFEILKIHTREWEPPPPPDLLWRVAARTTGYCGADLKAICAEATLVALRRAFPQIYFSKQRLQLDLAAIQVRETHFDHAVKKIVPSSQRGTVSYIKPLEDYLKPLFRHSFNLAIKQLEKTFPVGSPPRSAKKKVASSDSSIDYSKLDDLSSDEEDSQIIEILHIEALNCVKSSRSSHLPLVKLGKQMNFGMTSLRPRFLLCGTRGSSSQTHYLAPALLHRMEHVPVHRIDLPALYSGTQTGSTLEESLCALWKEALRATPAIIFLPQVDSWPTDHATLSALAAGLDPRLPILLFATADSPSEELPTCLSSLFSPANILHMPEISFADRRDFFLPLLFKEILRPPRNCVSGKKRPKEYPPLPLAPPLKPPPPTKEEIAKRKEEEDSVLREMRLFLRSIIAKLIRDRKFAAFVKPVGQEEAPDYLDVIAHPMCLSVMRVKIDYEQYLSAKDFLADIELICENALEYNPDFELADQNIRHRAFALKDTAYALITSELNPEFERKCRKIKENRQQRGDLPVEFNSKQYYTARREPTQSSEGENAKSPPPTYRTNRKQRLPDTLSSSPEPDSKKLKYSSGKSSDMKNKLFRRKKSLWFGQRRVVRRVVTTTTPTTPAVQATGSSPPPSNTPSAAPIHSSQQGNTLEENRTLKNPSLLLPHLGTESNPLDTSPSVLTSNPRKSTRMRSSSPIHPSSHTEHDKENLNTNSERTLGDINPTTRLVTVDVIHLKSLMEKVVRTTEGWPVDSLINLYHTFHTAIVSHQDQWDKKDLLNVLEEVLKISQ